MVVHVFRTGKTPNRYGPVQTAVALLREIRRTPSTLSELAAALECSARTVRRLINALRGCDVGIVELRRETTDGDVFLKGNQPIEYSWDGDLGDAPR